MECATGVHVTRNGGYINKWVRGLTTKSRGDERHVGMQNRREM